MENVIPNPRRPSQAGPKFVYTEPTHGTKVSTQCDPVKQNNIVLSG